MIETLELNGLPSFASGSAPIEPLATLSFIYGANGAGKSSIARRLYSTIGPGTTAELYNKDFVENLLLPDNDIPGVFVIRDGDSQTQTRIEELTGKPERGQSIGSAGAIARAQKNVIKLENSIKAEQEKLKAAENELKKEAWSHRKALDDSLQSCFTGYLNDSTKHLEKVLELRQSEATPNSRPIEELASESKILKSESPRLRERLPSPQHTSPLTEAEIETLQTPINTRSETTFAEFIDRIGAIDWIRHGTHYLQSAKGDCPFCQRPLPVDFTENLDDLFDTLYFSEIDSVKSILRKEQLQLASIETFKQELLSSSLSSREQIFAEIQAIESINASRIQLVQNKVEHPTKRVELPSFADHESRLRDLIEEENSEIDRQNKLVEDKKAALSNLRDEVWNHYIHEDLSTELAKYDGATDSPRRALSGLEPKLREARTRLNEYRTELEQLRRQLTSSLPTIDSINRTLISLGFLSFSISQLGNEDTYELTRADGSSARSTLSEGERSLISFLYFFHKLKELDKDATSGEPIIAIIDDPVSSLDGEALFVINLLLRELFEACVSGPGRLEQIVLLTHNAYFYKEADFTPKGMRSGHRSYFILRKGSDGKTTAHHYDKCPIKSNYAQLWDEVKLAAIEGGSQHTASLPNAMRRIIENYFHITGGLDTDKILSRIPEGERWACNTLLSWYNDGSHAAPWDVDYASIAAGVTPYLSAFKAIFVAAEHESHYAMMMKSDG